jgi:hypothetical protein
MEVVETTEATPSALEIIPVGATEAATAQLEKSEPKSSRTKQQPKLQSLQALLLPALRVDLRKLGQWSK